MNSMSTEIRKYELKARAEKQRETRERIAEVAVELHEEKGVARTTVSEIARRAGVTRLTVYNHFADLGELIPACAAHYGTRHPAPDLETLLEASKPEERDRIALEAIYGWYRETRPMFRKLFSDRVQVPELDRFMSEGIDTVQADLARSLVEGHGQEGRAAVEVEAIIRLALDFWTWERLDRQGIDDKEAARIMAGAIAATVGHKDDRQ